MYLFDHILPVCVHHDGMVARGLASLVVGGGVVIDKIWAHFHSHFSSFQSQSFIKYQRTAQNVNKNNNVLKIFKILDYVHDNSN